MLSFECNKVRSLADAVSENVRDGNIVFVGGFGQGVPFALGREIIRQGRRNLTLCRTGADILFDQMIAGGCVRSVIVGWIGNPGVGLSHVLRRALSAGSLEIEETSDFGLLLRLHAAALGIPYIPTRSLTAGDIPTQALASHKAIQCPFTGDKLICLPALAPDVAIVHAHRADCHGNVQMSGILGDTLEGANASSRVICTVEEIVTPEAIKAQPEQTILPASKVMAVCHAPMGAHPSYMSGLYDRDDAAYREFDRLSRDTNELAQFLALTVQPDHKSYVEAFVQAVKSITFPEDMM
jgi:glutaconate CoA-transferase subunit A